MNVYMVRFDSDDRVIEAESFGRAIEAWRIDLLAEWATTGDYDPETDDAVEPESVTLISEHPVIRVHTAPAEAASA